MEPRNRKHALHLQVTARLREVAGYYRLFKEMLVTQSSNSLSAENIDIIKNDIGYLQSLTKAIELLTKHNVENAYNIDEKIQLLNQVLKDFDGFAIQNLSAFSKVHIASEGIMVLKSEAVINKLKATISELDDLKKQEECAPPKKPTSNFEKYCKTADALLGGLLLQDPPEQIKGQIEVTKPLAAHANKLYQTYPYDFTPDEATKVLTELNHSILEIYKLMQIDKKLVDALNEDYEEALQEIKATEAFIKKDLANQLNRAASEIYKNGSVPTMIPLIEELTNEAKSNKNEKLSHTLKESLKLVNTLHAEMSLKVSPTWSTVNDQFLKCIASAKMAQRLTPGFFSIAPIPKVLKDISFFIQFHQTLQDAISKQEKVSQLLETTIKLTQETEDENLLKVLGELNEILTSIFSNYENGGLVIWHIVRDQRIENINIDKVNLRAFVQINNDPVHIHLREVLDFVDLNVKIEEQALNNTTRKIHP